MKLIKNSINSIKSNLKLFITLLIFTTILTAPLLHQTLPDYTCHFSLLTSIQSDLDEQQFATPYFLSIMFKDTKIVKTTN